MCDLLLVGVYSAYEQLNASSNIHSVIDVASRLLCSFALYSQTSSEVVGFIASGEWLSRRLS